ncbi:hypothetical protein K402DRAFT_398750 [Aulographum hederae CBS 113979]|uniref:Uncharacterized protein n=1 Tax=Aulographum hederae CBS 113979 TaxID=1176131 RepID=A0A6G1GK02_9PEZI|nr:hypothetical protein K402DRAFT_398750 [Aulographum hederae CBS 113979]
MTGQPAFRLRICGGSEGRSTVFKNSTGNLEASSGSLQKSIESEVQKSPGIAARSSSLVLFTASLRGARIAESRRRSAVRRESRRLGKMVLASN